MDDAITAQQRQLLNDVMDPTKVQLYCKDHMYFGPDKNNPNGPKPHMGCQKCWFVFYTIDIASAPPDKRYERLQELSEVVHHLVESVEKGTFDFTPSDHPTFEFSKE